MKSQEYSVHIMGAQLWDPTADNLDVEVRFVDGRRYGATFFTVESLSRLFAKNRATGECLNGLYLWAANMIVVQTLTLDVIQCTVDDLLRQDEFEKSFAVLLNSS